MPLWGPFKAGGSRSQPSAGRPAPEELRQLRGGLPEERLPTPAGQLPDPAPKPRRAQNRSVWILRIVFQKHPTGSANTHKEPAPRGALTHGRAQRAAPR